MMEVQASHALPQPLPNVSRRAPPRRFNHFQSQTTQIIGQMKTIQALVASQSTETVLPLSTSEQAAKKRKVDVYDPTIGVEERRHRILELQKEECRQTSVSETRIGYVDPTAVAEFHPFWTLRYERLLSGERTRMNDVPLTKEERDWVRSEARYDYCLFLWCHKHEKPDKCHRHPPCEPTERDEATQFHDTPNVQFFEEQHRDCYCASEDTILLCNDVSHQHSKHGWSTQIAQTHRDPAPTFSYQRSIDSIDRYRDRLSFGPYNQNIVATRVFGPGTRQRWDTMLEVASVLPEIQHSARLFNELDEVLKNDANFSHMRHCIWTFSYSSPKKERPGDRKMSLLPKTIRHLKSRAPKTEHCEPRTVADAGYLDSCHPIHWRFDAREGAETTLGVALFVEATKNSNWLTVWRLWVRIVTRHCFKCAQCTRRFIEFLSCVLLLEQLTPNVFSVEFRGRLEGFLLSLRALVHIE